MSSVEQIIFELRSFGYKYSSKGNSKNYHSHKIVLEENLNLFLDINEDEKSFKLFFRKTIDNLVIFYSENETKFYLGNVIAKNLCVINGCIEFDLDKEVGNIKHFADLKLIENLHEIFYRYSIKYDDIFNIQLRKYTNNTMLLDYFSGNIFVDIITERIQPQFVDIPFEII
jgi:hypothetical protein